MSRLYWVAAPLVALAAGGVGYWAGRVAPPSSPMVAQGSVASARSSEAAAAPSGPVLYYRDPDGAPHYSLDPKSTGDGRPYRAVHASEEAGFEDKGRLGQSAQASSGSAGKRILYYRNPMGLPDTSPTPKKDSMGMDYIPVVDGDDEDGSTISISPGKLQRTGVRSDPVKRRSLSLPIRVPGIIQLDERRVSIVSVRSPSFIEKVEAVTTGDRVRKGQSLMRLYSPEISAAAAQYLSVIGPPAGIAQTGMEGARRRLENLDVPADVMSEIDKTRRVPLSIAWPAPRDGIVTERSVIDGMRAMPGDVMFRLADVSVVWALLDVAERDLSMITLGQKVMIRPRSDSGREFTGKIGLIYPQINRETRTARLRVELANPNAALLPEMYVEAEIATGSDQPVLAVPVSAVIDSGNQQVVLIDLGSGRFEPRQIALGRRGDSFVEVREGVKEGDRVVTSANFLIDAESNIRAALRGLSSPEAAR